MIARAHSSGSRESISTPDSPSETDSTRPETRCATTGVPADEVAAARDELLQKVPGLAAAATGADAVAAAYERLVRAPSLLVSLSLEDAVLEERRPNVPGTVERDNWRLPLSVPVDQLADHPGAARLVALVTEALVTEVEES